jgi:uncharacterized protein YigE (DUF2233 family)
MKLIRITRILLSILVILSFSVRSYSQNDRIISYIVAPQKQGLQKGSANVNIRNGVGILPDNKIVLAISKEEINLYDFAEYFKNLGCKNALYLDGFVSRMYLPEKDLNTTDGDFGVIIGVSTKNR